MKSDRAFRIIESNLPKLVGLMVTVHQGTDVDVYCDETGSALSFSKPSGPATIKLCTVTAPDFAGSYGLHPKGAGYVDDDGEIVPNDRLIGHLTGLITNMKNEGAEWGWEFKVGDD